MPEHQQIQQSTKSKTTFQKQVAPRIQTPISNPMAIIQRARINPKSLTHADVMQLQRTIGNQAVARLFSEIGLIPSTAKPVQKQEISEEEKTCPSCMQKQTIPEEDEKLQGKFVSKAEQAICPSCCVASSVQRQESEEEEPLQGMMIETIQRQEIPEEEPLQGKMADTIQRQEIPEEEPLQTKRENNTGMPDNLKAGVESLSGIDMRDVRVHYNSSKPAEVGALAYTQGTNIHVAQGQERHLPHEAWHVIQQAQRRVQPTMQLKGVQVNDNAELEREADEMGIRALQMRHSDRVSTGPINQVITMKPQMGEPTKASEFPSAAIGNHVIQMIIISLDDLETLKKDKPEGFNEDEEKSAKTITESATFQSDLMRENILHTWKKGDYLLQNIVTDEIYIYGHGTVSDGVAIKFGKFTPEELVSNLITMGLQKEYTGLIYLDGCQTAVGKDYGFLGKFYQSLIKHCKNVRVKGNLGDSALIDKERYISPPDVKTPITEANRLRLSLKFLNDQISQIKITNKTIIPSILKIQTEMGKLYSELKEIMGDLEKISYTKATEPGVTVELPKDKSSQSPSKFNLLIGGIIDKLKKIDASLENLSQSGLNLQAPNSPQPDYEEQIVPPPPDPEINVGQPSFTSMSPDPIIMSDISEATTTQSQQRDQESDLCCCSFCYKKTF